MRNPTFLQRAAVAVSAWALCGLASAAAAPAFDVSVGDMAADQWQQTATAHVGNASVSFSVQALGGDSFWQTDFSRPAVAAPFTGTDVVSNIFLLQGWDPALQGAVDRIDVLLDARGFSSSFGNPISGFLRPVLQQGGRIFSVLGSDLTVMVGGSFATLSFSQEDSDNWRAADGSGDQPDFSATGSAMLFGYRFGIQTQCTGVGVCSSASTSLGVDNFQVDVIAAVPVDNNVPEPALPALLASAALAAAWQRRRKA